MKAIADEMSDCWWQFGEGKLNYVGLDERVAWKKTSCAICSTVEFDKEILDKNPKITYREFYEYLRKTPKDSSQTYLKYLYDSNDIDRFQNEISYLKIDIDKNLITEEGKYSIVTGVKVGSYWSLKLKIKDIFLYPYYIRSDNIVSELKCDEFINKA